MSIGQNPLENGTGAPSNIIRTILHRYTSHASLIFSIGNGTVARKSVKKPGRMGSTFDSEFESTGASGSLPSGSSPSPKDCDVDQVFLLEHCLFIFQLFVEKWKLANLPNGVIIFNVFKTFTTRIIVHHIMGT